MNSESGLTLLELILVMVLVGVLAGFISNMIFFEIDIYNFITSRSEALQNSRRVLQMMCRDIRQIAASNSIFQASTDSLRFEIVNDYMISYNFVNNQILRNGNPLSTGVNAFEFTYCDNSGNILTSPVTNPADIRSITLRLTTLIKGQSLTVQTKVTPRCF